MFRLLDCKYLPSFQGNTIFESSLIGSQEEFPLVSTEIILINNYGTVPDETVSKIIARGKLVVKSGNQFHIIPKGYHTPDMIFSCKHFNISSVLRFDRILLVVRLYAINSRETVLMKFVLSFSNHSVARSFHNYVKQVPDCIDESIEVPADFSPWK